MMSQRKGEFTNFEPHDIILDYCQEIVLVDNYFLF
jgi:hypothetical protein